MLDAYGLFQASSVAPTGGRRRYDPTRTGDWPRAFRCSTSLHWQAELKWVWGKLTGRSYGLLDLDDVRRTETIEADARRRLPDNRDQEDPGQRMPGLRFRQGLAAAEALEQAAVGQHLRSPAESDMPLPAISVVQVGDSYYVRDGHHRISVARLMGEEYIEAHVQVWQMKGRPVPSRD